MLRTLTDPTSLTPLDLFAFENIALEQHDEICDILRADVFDFGYFIDYINGMCARAAIAIDTFIHKEQDAVWTVCRKRFLPRIQENTCSKLPTSPYKTLLNCLLSQSALPRIISDPLYKDFFLWFSLNQLIKVSLS